MLLLVSILVGWVLLSLPIALVLGRTLRAASMAGEPVEEASSRPTGRGDAGSRAA